MYFSLVYLNSPVLKKSLFQVCFKIIQIIERGSRGNIRQNNKCCLIIFHRGPVQGKAMSGQHVLICKFRKTYPLVIVQVSAVNTCILNLGIPVT